MIVLMDKMIAPSSRELAQRLYDKNIELENRRRRSAQARVPSDPNAWQQMRENYETIILEDHDFSEQHSIEYALWQLHYRRIEEFRAHFSSALTPLSSTPSHGGKGPTRPDRITKIRLQFKTFLSEATGFYHDLILKIRAKYGLPLGSFSEESDNRMLMEKDKKKFAGMKGLISCHRCLIYLGDLARYKGLYGEGDSKNRDYAAASSYYLQAASLLPSSGNPHHQLAILASYSSDELVAIYRYFRSLAVDTPFSTARDNLIVAFEKNRHSFGQLLGDVKISAPRESCVRMNAKGRGKGEAKLQSKDTCVETGLVQGVAASIHESFKAFCIKFVRLNGILFTRTSLETFPEVLSSVCSGLNELLSSGSEEELNFGVDAFENELMIVRLISILIFTVYNVNRQGEGQTYAEILQRNVLLQNAFTAVFEFMGHIMKRCTQLHNPSLSYLLPGILVFVEWLAACPDVAVGTDMDDKQAAVRSMFWNNCVLFLNQLLSDRSVSVDEEDETCFFNMSRYEEGGTENRLALWEDFELRGFLPLLPAQSILDFSRKHSSGSEGTKEKKARVRRVLAAGKALANVVQVDKKTVYFDSKGKKFVVGSEPLMSGDSIFKPYLGVPLSKGIMQETLAARAKSPGALQANIPLHVEGEEEDEVIVFKPTVSEKHSDVIDLNWSAYNGLEPAKNASAGDLQFYDGAVSAPLSDFYEHAALCVGLQPPLSVADSVPIPQHLLPVQSCTSSWFVEQENSLANDLKYLNMFENQLPRKPDMREDMSISHSAAFSLPIQQSFNYNGSGLSYSPIGVLEAVMPSKIDSIVSSSAKTESSVALPAFPAGSRKIPVSRPSRHLGPPPGFSPVPSKLINEPKSGSDLKSENPLMDDYSWLDGYQLPPSMEGTGINNSMSHAFDGNSQLVSKSNGIMGPISFPFPGKQVSAMQFQVDKPKAWQDYEPLEHLDLQHEPQLHQPQLMKGNQQLVPLPEQYQGQSIWTGHYFV